MDQLAGLSEEARKLALDRFRLLQPHLEDKLLPEVGCGGSWNPVPDRSALGIAVSAVRVDGSGPEEAGRYRRAPLGFRKAKGLALQKPPIPATAIYRQVRRLAQDLGEEPPSYWLVYRIVAALPADLYAPGEPPCGSSREVGQ
jgi:putative transposase